MQKTKKRSMRNTPQNKIRRIRKAIALNENALERLGGEDLSEAPEDIIKEHQLHMGSLKSHISRLKERLVHWGKV